MTVDPTLAGERATQCRAALQSLEAFLKWQASPSRELRLALPAQRLMARATAAQSDRAAAPFRRDDDLTAAVCATDHVPLERSIHDVAALFHHSSMCTIIETEGVPVDASPWYPIPSAFAAGITISAPGGA